MAHESPRQPRAGLSSLPHELLELIVKLVAEQDVRTRKWASSLANHAPPEDNGRSQASLQDGQFSWWYGHGVSALSLVSKGLRSLALPHLLPYVEAAQLHSPFFQFGHVPIRMLAGVKELDLRAADPASFGAAVRALRYLPNLRCLLFNAEIETEVECDLAEDGTEGDDALVQRGLAQHANKVAELRIYRFEDDLFVDTRLLRRLACPTALRRLAFSGQERWHFDPADNFLSQLTLTFPHLEELAISSVVYFDLAELARAPEWRGAVFPRLRKLALKVGSVHVFQLISSLAPNVVIVELSFLKRFPGEQDLGGVPKPFLPELRDLTIRGWPSCACALSLVDTSLLTYLEISTSLEDPTPVDCATFLPPDVVLPRGLHFKLVLHSLNTLSDEDEFRASCAEQGVEFVRRNKTVIAPFLPPSRSVDEARAPHAAAGRRRKKALRAVERALERVRWAMELGDARAVQEMAETVRKVEERRVLESL
ncbi:hypothetical protein DMC30DRAFT_449399 [Rhodotorula diobovata]|uniref:Proteophosphoglycan ppg4 n=1 Tax=Rhodotorula diobovata TaxID=5288 RepID=A0A5C5FND0_9BASI|nr:hypothetical protein DMC30DRAFT_449399 [Rhodotorula diobovata]